MLHLTPELVRIHAHLCGDGCVCQYKTSEPDRINRILIGYYNNNIALLNAFRADMHYQFGVRMTHLEKQNTMKVQSIKIGKYLLALSSYGSRLWRIPDIIKNSSRAMRIEWIRAYALDEGYVPKDRNSIRIKSMNPHGLKDMKEMLDQLGIISNITGPNCDDSFYINIKRMLEFKNFTKVSVRK